MNTEINHIDKEAVIANTSLDDFIRIKEAAILKQQQELQDELNKIRTLHSGEKKENPTERTVVLESKINDNLNGNNGGLSVHGKVLKAFREAGKGLTNQDLVKILGLELKVVRDATSKLKLKGMLRADKLNDKSLVKTFYLV